MSLTETYLCVFDHAGEDLLDAILATYILPVDDRRLEVDVVHGCRASETESLLNILTGDEMLLLRALRGGVHASLTDDILADVPRIPHQVGEVLAVVRVRSL